MTPLSVKRFVRPNALEGAGRSHRPRADWRFSVSPANVRGMKEESPFERAGRLRKRLAERSGHVHLLGICGVGMAGLALLLKERGLTVSGCDVHPNRRADDLRARGIEVRSGHAAGHLATGVDWVIRSSAVPLDEAEVRAAGERDMLFGRGEVLAGLLTGLRSVAVSGTHGKTTTTSFITRVLAFGGLRPSWCIGGDVPGLDGVGGAGGGDVMVVEADESDGTVALYEPDVAVITNIEYDHMEHFESRDAFEACFRTLMARTRRCLVYCADDPRAAVLGMAAPAAIGYGLGPGADLTGSELTEGPDSVAVTVRAGADELGRITLSVPGRHNALNALAALAVGREFGVPFDVIRSALESAPLPGRRFECVARRGGVRVISDYAHHPTEIAALIRTARQQSAHRRVAVFQPHRYTRTRALGADFPAAFAGVDELVLTPVYAASEAMIEGGTTADLYRHFRETPVSGVPVPRLADSLEAAWSGLRATLQEGDLLLVIGAGDVVRVAQWAADELNAGHGPDTGRNEAVAHALRAKLTASEVRLDEPLAPRTTLGVGGRADIAVHLGRVEDLARLLATTHEQNLPVRILGRGSNVLVSDLGLRGVTAWLSGPAFGAIDVRDGWVVAGAGISLPRLLGWTEEQGWSGLEFLEGVPGSLGGALRMNAGAFGSDMGQHVAWVRRMNPDGTECRIEGDALGVSYRHGGVLSEGVVFEAGLKLHKTDADTVRFRRREVARKRAWMKGLRSAGSVFRNPPGDFAGRLIEQAGLKGFRVGGAEVSPRHANVIAVTGDATASDVRALMEIMRARVRFQFGVELTDEIVFLESGWAKDSQGTGRGSRIDV